MNFSLEVHPTCSYDFLEFCSITEGFRSLIGRYCGMVPPTDFTTQAETLAIKFVSNRIGNYAGFVLTYKVREVSTFQPSKLLSYCTFVGMLMFNVGSKMIVSQ